MRIVTYNVNGLRPRVSQHGSLLKFLNSLQADIICIQVSRSFLLSLLFFFFFPSLSFFIFEMDIFALTEVLGCLDLSSLIEIDM